MTTTDPPRKVSRRQRLSQRFRRWLNTTTERMAPRDIDSGREPISKYRKLWMAIGSMTALAAWGLIFVWVLS